MPECHVNVYSLNTVGLSMKVMSQFYLQISEVWERH